VPLLHHSCWGRVRSAHVLLLLGGLLFTWWWCFCSSITASGQQGTACTPQSTAELGHYLLPHLPPCDQRGGVHGAR
jgi:hypothetical protein